jgi:hypothetical protein
VDGYPIYFEDTTMPFTQAQLVRAGHYAYETNTRNDPIDQVNQERPFLDWLMRNKAPSTFGAGYHNENIYTANDSNYQNYAGADQVTFNERDPVRQAKFPWYNAHDGFWFDEDRLAAAGIVLDDEGNPSKIEVDMLADLFKSSHTALKEGFLENFALEAVQNGSQSTKAAPGLDHLVSTTPNTGTVGGIDAATATYWRNNTNLGIVAANVVDEMEQTWRDVTRYGGMRPDFILVGAAFLDNYRTQAGATINRQLVVNQQGGTGLDPSVTGLYFKGVPLVHDHIMEDMDVIDPGAAIDWTKRAYFLNSKVIKLRPMKKFWMRSDKPEKLPDRYVTYFGKRSKYAFTTNKRNALAVMSIA